MRKEKAKAPEVIVLATGGSTGGGRDKRALEIGAYVVNSCHRPFNNKAVAAVITGQTGHFLYHMPFSYLLN